MGTDRRYTHIIVRTMSARNTSERYRDKTSIFCSRWQRLIHQRRFHNVWRHCAEISTDERTIDVWLN